MVRKMRVGVGLQPIVTALFANSPFRDGKLTGMAICFTFITTLVPSRTCFSLGWKRFVGRVCRGLGSAGVLGLPFCCVIWCAGLIATLCSFQILG